MAEINKVSNRNEDSVYIYKVSNPHNIKKDVYGVNRNLDDLLI